jgi:hypothetical protein
MCGSNFVLDNMCLCKCVHRGDCAYELWASRSYCIILKKKNAGAIVQIHQGIITGGMQRQRGGPWACLGVAGGGKAVGVGGNRSRMRTCEEFL